MREYGFEEGEDFNVLKNERVQMEGSREVKREITDYNITVDMAKQICMIQRTPEGKECRQYLIDLEKAWNSPEQIMARALRVAEKVISDKDRLITEMKPKADFFDAVADSKTAISMNEASKVLAIKGMGRNNLFEYLRQQGILDRRNIPYQKYVDNGWFRVIEQHYSKNGEEQISFKTLVYQKGVNGIRKMITEEAS
jgi:anti-repressor protein